MLLLRRKLNEVTYIGENLSGDDLEGTYDCKIIVKRIVDSFEAPKVLLNIHYANGDGEHVEFVPSEPEIHLEDGSIKLCAISSVRERDGALVPFVTLGFTFPDEVRIVRDNARNKT